VIVVIEIRNPKFPLGQVVMTCGVSGAQDASPEFAEFVAKSIQRHTQGDWGDLDEDDRRLNDAALKSGSDRLFSAYEEGSHPKIWIITEWDRSVTTILFPDDY
jgi:hypothetical protein